MAMNIHNRQVINHGSRTGLSQLPDWQNLRRLDCYDSPNSNILEHVEHVEYKCDSTNTCNICYDENKKTKKCNTCVLHVCNECYIRVNNTKCVHCKNLFLQ